MRKTDCPVIAVPAYVEMNAISKILVPLDIAEIQDDFMMNIERLQRFFSAEVEFIWIRTPHCKDNEEEVRQQFDTLMKKI